MSSNSLANSSLDAFLTVKGLLALSKYLVSISLSIRGIKEGMIFLDKI